VHVKVMSAVRTRGATWLATLLLAAAPPALAAQAQPFSIDDITELVRSGVSDARILELARRDCLLFELDTQSDADLRASGASATLVRGLRTACYAGAALEVTSDPAGMPIWLGRGRVGTTPWRAQVLRGRLTVAVSRGEWRESVTAQIPAHCLVRLHFVAPADTMPWPVEPTRDQLASSLEASVQWAPSRPEPDAPAPFVGKHPIGRQIAGGVVGALLGGAAGYAIDRDSLTGPGLVLVGGIGWFVGKKLDDAAYKRRVKEYQRGVSDHESVAAAWRQEMDSERAELLNRLVDSALVTEHARADSLRAVVRAENERILQRNRTLPAPTVTVERVP